MPAKDTEQLENELTAADDVKKFLDDNAENLREFTFAEYLKLLMIKKNLRQRDLIYESCVGSGYAPHIFSGRNIPSREKVLMLALAMKLSPDETNYLLYYSGHEKLYARNPWDAIIRFALEKCKSISETNELLRDSNMKLLPIRD